jgi:RNase P subunit RPR2
MAEQFMFICDACYEDYKQDLHIEQEKTSTEATCAFCGRKARVKYSKVVYGKRTV